MKNRILLITPENKEINSYHKLQFNNFVQITMPYLAGFIDENIYSITLVDEYNQSIPYKRKFELVAITVNTPNACHCYTIAERFRHKNIPVVLGGPHVTLMPEEAKRYGDFLIIGEAENIWPGFLQDFYNGIARNYYTCKYPPSLEALPIARRDLIHGRNFTKGAVFATRGCPYNCRFCNLKQIYCPSFRMRPIEDVINDIKTISKKYFVFWDDNFFGNIEYSKCLLKKLSSLNKKWAAQVTIDQCLDEELLSRAHDSGCLYLFIGLESFCEETLDTMNKISNRVSLYRRAINLIHFYGISVQAGIIFGFDTDDINVFKKTLKTCKELEIDGVTPSILTPFPGTPIFKEFKKTKRLLSLDWTYFNGKTRVAFQPKHMTIEELFAGYHWFRKKYYSYFSIIKRLFSSKTNKVYNFIINLGYKFSL